MICGSPFLGICLSVILLLVYGCLLIKRDFVLSEETWVNNVGSQQWQNNLLNHCKWQPRVQKTDGVKSVFVLPSWEVAVIGLNQKSSNLFSICFLGINGHFRVMCTTTLLFMFRHFHCFLFEQMFGFTNVRFYF